MKCIFPRFVAMRRQMISLRNSNPLQPILLSIIRQLFLFRTAPEQYL